MSQIENLRQQLHKILETEDRDNILKVSQELDVLIVSFMMKNAISKAKMSL